MFQKKIRRIPFLSRMQIKNQIYFVFCLTVVFPVMLLGFFTIRHTAEILYDRAYQQLESDNTRAKSVLFDVTLNFYSISDDIIADSTLKSILQKDYASAAEARSARESYGRLATTLSNNASTVSHRDQAVEAFTAAYRLNRDCALVDLREIENQYRVLILPGNAEMTPETEASIRKQLEGGATVIMTAFSAKVDENNQVFDTSLPGRLCDVFGVKVRGFDRAVTHVSAVNVGSLEKTPMKLLRRKVSIGKNGETWLDEINYHEFLELTTAQPLVEYEGAEGPFTTAISCNPYGKGKAIYVGVPADEKMLRKLLEDVCAIQPAFNGLPLGIAARALDEDKTLYVNTTREPLTFPGEGRGLFTGKEYKGQVCLPPYEVELLER